MISRNIKRMAEIAAATTALSVAALGAAQSTVLTNSDGVIRNSLCVGLDCPDAPSFGADTIRLQENNLRINFLDTSNSGSFPTTDWRLEANSSQNGGLNYFAIQDADTNRNIALFEGGAPANSLYVRNDGNVGGNVGFGTSLPVVDLHAVSGNTPALRLEQNTSNGFAAQTWDLAGNETSFFLRDVTNGSALPLRVFPGSASGTLNIRNSRVGIGTISPNALLHLRNSGAGATGLPRIEFENADAAPTVWDMDVTDNADFRMSVVGSGQAEYLMNPNGNLTIAGALTQNSDRNAKTDIFKVNEDEILQKVAALDISEWSYKDDLGVRHIGPMAQDFHALFRTGATDKGITTIDTSGVALASIKAMNRQLAAKDAELKVMQGRLSELSARLADLEMK